MVHDGGFFFLVVALAGKVLSKVGTLLKPNTLVLEVYTYWER